MTHFGGDGLIGVVLRFSLRIVSLPVRLPSQDVTNSFHKLIAVNSVWLSKLLNCCW